MKARQHKGAQRALSPYFQQNERQRTEKSKPIKFKNKESRLKGAHKKSKNENRDLISHKT
jgi:hypothetical protein